MNLENFLQKGFEKGMWNKECLIILQKASLYGTGKIFLGSLSIALKGHSVNSNIGYKEIEKASCKAFNQELDLSISEPYKAFSSGDHSYIREIKKAFGIR